MKTKMIGIAMAAIMIASIFGAIIPMGLAVSEHDNFNHIDGGTTDTVLVGQNVKFEGTGWSNPANVVIERFDAGEWYYYDGPFTAGEAYNVDWSSTLTLRARDGAITTSLAIKTPNVPLKLKVGTKEVSSIAKGTDLTIDVGGINIF
jgi:hypothetical protein